MYAILLLVLSEKIKFINISDIRVIIRIYELVNDYNYLYILALTFSKNAKILRNSCFTFLIHRSYPILIRDFEKNILFSLIKQAHLLFLFFYKL